MDSPFCDSFTYQFFSFFERIAKLLNNETISVVFQAAAFVLASDHSMNAKCEALQFIGECCKVKGAWDWLSEYFDWSLENIIYPLFSLTAEDVDNAARNASAFVQENHRVIGCYEDLKSGAADILVRCCGLDQECALRISLFARKVLQKSDIVSHEIMSLILMCSSVLRDFWDFFEDFGVLCIEMAHTSDVLLRSAGLLGLSYCPSTLITEEMVALTMGSLIDGELLVKYYAAILLSHILETVNKSNLSSIHGLLGCTEDLFHAVLTLCAEFSDWSIATCLYSLTVCFGSEIVAVGNLLTEQFLKMVMNDLEADCKSQAIIALQSVDELFMIMTQRSNLFEVFPLLMNCMDVITDVDFLRNSYLYTIKDFFECCPFHSEFWVIIDHCKPECRFECCCLIETLCKKDVSLASKSELIQTLTSMIDDTIGTSDFLDMIPVVTGLCMRVPSDSLISRYIVAVMNVLSIERSTQSIRAICSIILFNPLYVQDFLNEIVQELLDCTFIDLLPIALIRLYEIVDTDYQARIMQYLSSIADRFDDSDDEDHSLDTLWFTTSQIRTAVEVFSREI